jgi:NAD(P)-dependent dehydrogenase (short-subunit alcohol dehydrogenase family)
MDGNFETTVSQHSAVVIGANGGIGGALVDALASDRGHWQLHAGGRSAPARLPGNARYLKIDISDERSIRNAAAICAAPDGLDLVIVATGMLHDGADRMPEKSWNDIDPEMFAQSFAINCTAPALIAKQFLPLMARDRRSVFAVLGARVGSISDNRLGGWYAYRASKAALSMVIRTLAIELQRSNPQALCIGLHPGTVDTRLSAPFQSRVPADQLFTPEYAARRLLDVISGVDPADSGSVLAWDGQTIPP